MASRTKAQPKKTAKRTRKPAAKAVMTQADLAARLRREADAGRRDICALLIRSYGVDGLDGAVDMLATLGRLALTVRSVECVAIYLESGEVQS